VDNPISEVGAGPHRPPTSLTLQQLLAAAPTNEVTLHWLIMRLGDRSFGVVLLLLGLLGFLPGVSGFAGILLAVPAVQMILSRPGPVLPRRISQRPFSTRQLARLIRRVIPVLRCVERFSHPRHPRLCSRIKPLVGVVVLLQGCALVAPVPLSNLPPAMAVVLTAFAYLEEDGVLLLVALAGATIMIGAAAMLGWEGLSIAGWVPGFL
jgi:hypothetical protein